MKSEAGRGRGGNEKDRGQFVQDSTSSKELSSVLSCQKAMEWFYAEGDALHCHLTEEQKLDLTGMAKSCVIVQVRAERLS